MFHFEWLWLFDVNSNAESASKQFDVYTLDVRQVPAMPGWYNDYLNIIFIQERVCSLIIKW